MSIKGFEVGGVQERYDYTALDNTPANLVQDGNYVHTDNNYTNADKTKLDGIATGANKTIIDSTLTQSGQAADAKATGDELDDLKSAFTANLINDTASGAIANFPDGAALPVRDLSVDIEPVQDLHGYDNPWPAGAKNKIDINGEVVIGTRNPTDAFPVEQGDVIKGFSRDGYQRPNNATATVNGNDVTVTITQGSYGYGYVCAVTAGETYTFSHADGNWVGLTWLDANKVLLSFESNTYGNYTKTAPNGAAYAVFALLPSATGTPTTYKNVMVEKGSTATSYVPYSNICPISGWTGAKVTRTGKNLINQQAAITGTYTNTYYKECTVNGGEISAVHLLAGVTYTLSFDVVSSVEPFAISVGVGTGNYARDIKSGSGDVRNLYSGRISATFTPTSEQLVSGDIIAFRAPRYDTAKTFTFTISNIQLEVGSTATAYEPYQSQTYTIDLNGTVYGGTLDVTTGKLTVDRAMVDLGGLNWEQSTLSSGAMRGQVNNVYTTSSQIVTPAIMDRRKAMAWSPLGAQDIDSFAISTSGQVIVPVGHAVESIQEFLDEYGDAQLCYPLATPIVYDLTPTEVTTLLGTNNVWADTGDTNVDYYADPTLYINRKIAAAVAAMS